MKRSFLYNFPCAIVLFIVILLFPNCKKFVQVPPAPNLVSSSQVFTDSSDASAAVIGLYLQMDQGVFSFTTFNGNITLYMGLSADELYSTTGNSNEIATYENALLPSTNSVLEFWVDSYSLIYKCNAILEGLPNPGITSTANNQFLGEAKTIRALAYFYLVNIYGAVPLVVTTNYQISQSQARTSTDSVYKQIITDLVSADSLLTDNYPTTGRNRINKYAAMALLSRVYLYTGDWVDAENTASQIINSGLYSLDASLNNVFLAGSNEAILQISPSYPGAETTEGYMFVPSTPGIVPNYVINSYLLNSFEANDQRRVDWLDSNVVNGQAYYYPYKYKLGFQGGTSAPTENYMVFRLAEQYLIRAEAEANGGNGGLAAAVADVNLIRNRAGLNPVNPSTPAAVEAVIQHERQVELFCEWGHRWFDLKRTDSVNSVMGGANGVCAMKGGSWNADWQLYPIYISEIQANPNLKQNPGYE